MVSGKYVYEIDKGFDAEALSKKYGAESIKRGSPLDGSRSGYQKIQMNSGGSVHGYGMSRDEKSSAISDYREGMSGASKTAVSRNSGITASEVREANKEMNRLRNVQARDEEVSKMNEFSNIAKERGMNAPLNPDAIPAPTPERKVSAKTTKQVRNSEWDSLTREEQEYQNLRRESGLSAMSPEITGAEQYGISSTSVEGDPTQLSTMSKEQKMAASTLTEIAPAFDQGDPEAVARFNALPEDVQAAYYNKKAYEDWEASDKGMTAKEAREQMKAERLAYGLDPGDTIDGYDSNGDPIVNGMSLDEYDMEKSRKRIEADRTDQLREANQAQSKREASIRSAYTVNGVLTQQGVEQLANSKRDFSEEMTTYNRHVDENIEDLTMQTYRKIKADQASKKSETTAQKSARIKAEEADIGAKSLMAEYAASGNAKSYTFCMDQWNKQNKFDDSVGDEYKTGVSSLDELAKGREFDPLTMFQNATTEFNGDASLAEKYMKSRGYLETDILAQKEAYQKEVMGYTDEQIKASKDTDRVEKLALRALKGEELTASQFEDVWLYEMEHPEEARRMELMLLHGKEGDNTMSEAQIFLQAKADFTKPKATGAGYTPTSSVDMFLADNPNFTLNEIADYGTKYGLSAKDKTYLKDQLVEKGGDQYYTPKEKDTADLSYTAERWLNNKQESDEDITDADLAKGIKDKKLTKAEANIIGETVVRPDRVQQDMEKLRNEPKVDMTKGKFNEDGVWVTEGGYGTLSPEEESALNDDLDALLQ